jgi:hypothetical protein
MTGGVVQVVECLLIKYEALSTNPETMKKAPQMLPVLLIENL